MATGACGINCDVCKLNVIGICSTCGAGTSSEGFEKYEVQKRVLGSPCPILACARLNGIAYCTRDCDQFPCVNFEQGPYPFSEGYLTMQKRRREQKPPAKTPQGNIIEIPPEFWKELSEKDPHVICANALAATDATGAVTIGFLEDEIRVDIKNRELQKLENGEWKTQRNSLLELVLLVYLLRVQSDLISNDIVSPAELKEGHFFQGPHELETSRLVKRYGNDPEGFGRAARKLGGTPVKMADAAFRLKPLPKIPVYYLLWLGDAEFEPRLSILFDRSIERHLSADAIWGLVNLVSSRLYEAGK